MEDFVTFDLAVELKEKGFRKPCIATYDKDGMLGYNYVQPTSIRAVGFEECLVYSNDCVMAPTISQVLKWLREKHSIHISTKPYPCEDGLMWLYEIRRFNEHTIFVIANKTGFVKEEQAALAGIEYTINLI